MNVLDCTVFPNSWQPNLKSCDRDEALKEMLDAFCSPEFLAANPGITKNKILKALIAREGQRTTAVGRQIAFPHARMENLNTAYFAIGILPNEVSFGPEPVRIICLILVPASDQATSLKIMAQMSRKLSDEESRRSILLAGSPEVLKGLFHRTDLRMDGPVCARDIMQLPKWSVKEITTIAKCASLMSHCHLRTVPVLNDENKIVGEVTSEHLFRYGLPDFFAKLKSVSFIAEFDPFEKYFEDEREMLICDVMDKDVQMVPLDYTIMEIVFDLAVKKFNMLYVIDHDGNWVGTIDQETVLNNVINF